MLIGELLIFNNIQPYQILSLSIFERPVQNTMKIKPINDKVLVQAITQDEVTKSGIVLPDTVDKERPEKGKVMAVGAGRVENGQKVPMTVKVGDTVVFKKYSPDEVNVEGKEYLVISESDIIAIIE